MTVDYDARAGEVDLYCMWVQSAGMAEELNSNCLKECSAKLEVTVMDFFQPPGRDSQANAHSAWTREDRAPELPDLDYGLSIYRLADSEVLYSRLPKDWPELYIKELGEGGTAYNVLRTENGRIVHDLGVEMDDVDPDAAS